MHWQRNSLLVKFQIRVLQSIVIYINLTTYILISPFNCWINPLKIRESCKLITKKYFPIFISRQYKRFFHVLISNLVKSSWMEVHCFDLRLHMNVLHSSMTLYTKDKMRLQAHVGRNWYICEMGDASILIIGKNSCINLEMSDKRWYLSLNCWYLIWEI